jgi:extracellular factor (EF) 3-hydroxypalmitic acid methyl ester biosynthesis protein
MYNSLIIDDLLNKEKKRFIKYLVETGGPELHDFDKFTSIVNNIEEKSIDSFREIIMPILNTNTLIGHGFVKPYGYPGDFALIHHIYQFYINEDDRYRNWDVFFQNQAGAIAVRNRKEYFLKQCTKMVSQNNKEIRVLILGSGPANDVNEFLKSYPGNNISFDLVDFDQNAIDFSRKKNEMFNKVISYNRINVLRYKPYKMYHLIWSAGLFDYFKDKHFIYLIRKYMNCLAKEGEFVISNFSTENPTKRLMEVLSDWYLNYRNKADLVRLAEEAGIDEGMVEIDSEPLEINLFLKIRAVKN